MKEKKTSVNICYVMLFSCCPYNVYTVYTQTPYLHSNMTTEGKEMIAMEYPITYVYRYFYRF